MKGKMKIIKVKECSYCFYRDTFYTTPMTRPIALCNCGDNKQILDMGEFKDGFPADCPLDDDVAYMVKREAKEFGSEKDDR